MTQQWGPGDPYQGHPAQPFGAYPSLGGLPMAPAEQQFVPVPRPGIAVSAAVLAFVESGFTLIGTFFLIGLSAGPGAGNGGLLGGLAVAQLVGMATLITGGVLLLNGRDRITLIAGATVHLALCVVYVVVASRVPTRFDAEDPNGARAALTLAALAFAVMPLISLIQASMGSVTGWMAAVRGRRY